MCHALKEHCTVTYHTEICNAPHGRAALDGPQVTHMQCHSTAQACQSSQGKGIQHAVGELKDRKGHTLRRTADCSVVMALRRSPPETLPQRAPAPRPQLHALLCSSRCTLVHLGWLHAFPASQQKQRIASSSAMAHSWLRAIVHGSVLGCSIAVMACQTGAGMAMTPSTRVAAMLSPVLAYSIAQRQWR